MYKVAPTRQARQRRHKRARRNLRGTAQRPRLAVFRSLDHIYAQLIDDDAGRTLVAMSTVSPALRAQLGSAKKTAQATVVGRALAEEARRQGITEVVFDRGGFLYHGRVKALAEAAREGGLVF